MLKEFSRIVSKSVGRLKAEHASEVKHREGIDKKRTATEVLMVNERLNAIDGIWRWRNTQQQLADGLTKNDWALIYTLNQFMEETVVIF